MKGFILRSVSPLPAIAVVSILIFLCGDPAQMEVADATSSFTTFDAPGAGTTASSLQGTAAFGINAAGDVVGFETDQSGVRHGFVRAAGGSISEFEAPDAGTSRSQGTLALSIDTGGDVAGAYLDANNVYHGFVRAAGGAITEFDVTGAGIGRNQGTNPFGINADGTITGFDTDTNGVTHGFARTANGTISNFDAPGAGALKGQGTRAFGIDAAGDITGFYTDGSGVFHGYVRSASGSIATFDAKGAGLSPFLGTLPFGIDAAGDVAGLYLDTNSAAHGFMRLASGVVSSFDVPGAGTTTLTGSFPLSINASGVIAGFDVDAKAVLHGFTRAADGVITTFDVPGAGTSMGTGGGEAALEGSGGFSINDSGAIAGSYLDSNSVIHGFVVAPPELGTAGFTISGTAVSISPGAASGNTSTITVTPSGGFTGNVALSAAVTSSPSGAVDPPAFSFNTTSPVDITGATARTAMLSVITTPSTSSAFALPRRSGAGWYTASGAALAGGLFFGIPGRRRNWRKMLGTLVWFLVITAGLVGCGPNIKFSGGGTNPGTTPGSYTVTVTGTSGATTESGTFTLTVQ